MNKNVKNKKVLITGAASGIGRATALDFSRAGAQLILTDINKDELEKTARMIEDTDGAILLSYPADISSYADVLKLREEVERKCGLPSIIINVAGVALFSQLEDMDMSDWQRVLGVNLWGVVHVIDLFVKPLVKEEQPGHLINVSSTAGLIGLPWHSAYSAGKFGVVGLSEVLYYDLKKHGIHVTVVCPGAVNTPLTVTAPIRGNPELVNKNRVRFQKMGSAPEKISRQILKAASTKKFMVITSLDIKLFYLLKRYLPLGYNIFMGLVTKLMDSQLLGKADKGAPIRTLYKES